MNITQSETTLFRTSISFCSTADRLVAIEGLRGFGMMLVFWGHFEVLFRQFLVPDSLSDQIVSFFGVWGHRGVSFFFVITGYFVYSKFMDRHTDYPSFVKKRLYRVVPLYWFMLGLYVALSFIVPSESKLPSESREAVIYIAQNTLFLQGFMWRPMIVVSWALTYLVLAYVLLPVVVIATGMRKWVPWHRVILVITGAGVWLTVCRAYPLLSPRPIMIAVGMLVYEAVRIRPFLRRLNVLSEASSTGLLILSLVLWYAMDRHFLTLPYESRYLFLGVGLFAVCLHTFTYDGMLKKLFERRFLAKLGQRGYAYYLIHGLTLKAVITVLSAMGVITQRSSAIFWILLPISFVATLWTSTVLYRSVELPLGRLFLGKAS
jgi:exopolysaccharide production protein ExoZ